MWDPNSYSQGNYFQNQVSESFCKRFNEQLFGNILDVGSGDGCFSHRLANGIKQGNVLGIDKSKEMIQHANENWVADNLSFQSQDIENYQSSPIFDFVLSFWCLHWTNIHNSIPNIYNALKHNGKFYAVFSSLSDNSILQTWRELAKQKHYAELNDRCDNTLKKSNENFYSLIHLLQQLSFKNVRLNLKTTTIYLPDISYFRNLLVSMPFIKKVAAERMELLITDMIDAFKMICKVKYNGELYYETRPIFLEATK